MIEFDESVIARDKMVEGRWFYFIKTGIFYKLKRLCHLLCVVIVNKTITKFLGKLLFRLSNQYLATLLASLHKQETHNYILLHYIFASWGLQSPPHPLGSVTCHLMDYLSRVPYNDIIYSTSVFLGKLLFRWSNQYIATFLVSLHKQEFRRYILLHNIFAS